MGDVLGVGSYCCVVGFGVGVGYDLAEVSQERPWGPAMDPSGMCTYSCYHPFIFDDYLSRHWPIRLYAVEDGPVLLFSYQLQFHFAIPFYLDNLVMLQHDSGSLCHLPSVVLWE
jgi:hypothetical protein